VSWKLLQAHAFVQAHRFARALRLTGFWKLGWCLDEVIGWNAAELRLPQLRRNLRIM
jgi:hypothetical protein